MISLSYMLHFFKNFYLKFVFFSLVFGSTCVLMEQMWDLLQHSQFSLNEKHCQITKHFDYVIK